MVFLSFGTTSGVESVLKLIGLIILCVIIIAASYYTTRFVGKRQAGMTGDSNFKSLDIFRINQNKYLQLIAVGKRYFVIAVSKDNVQLIAELQEEDITYWRSEKKMSFKEEFKKVIQELNSMDNNDDFKHEELWKKEVKIITENMDETIKYLKTDCTADEFSWLSEIFREIVETCPSKEFVDELYKLAEKYPEETKKSNIISFIDEAAGYLEED